MEARPLMAPGPAPGESSGQVPARHWAAHTAQLRKDLREAVPAETLRSLHRLSPGRHFAVAGLLVLAASSAAAGILHVQNPWGWVPLSLLLGLCLFDFTILLHEVLHRLVFAGPRRSVEPVLAWLYALPSGIAPSQFTRWHLDHHAGLGSENQDPKRHRLSPKRNARWFKALYFTPALIPIYFRAAARETATYDRALRRRISGERLAAVALHAALAAGIAWTWGWMALVKLYAVPYLFGFPLAFGLNRLGQHYDVDPEDPARWGTRMRRSIFWDAAFLWSGYHLEHHYFPGVPFYRLRALNGALAPFFEARRIPARSYVWLAWQYLVRNRRPHTRWA